VVLKKDYYLPSQRLAEFTAGIIGDSKAANHQEDLINILLWGIWICLKFLRKTNP